MKIKEKLRKNDGKILFNLKSIKFKIELMLNFFSSSSTSTSSYFASTSVSDGVRYIRN